MNTIELTFGEFTITIDREKMKDEAIHDFLSKHSTWSPNIPFERVKTSLDHSLNFGLFHAARQIGKLPKPEIYMERYNPNIYKG